MATAAYETTGAGGKLRKKPLRRNHQTTPYDRPPTAATGLRNPSWLTKLVVDPASKLITSGAHRFFGSIFRRRLPAPHPTPLPPGPSQESKDLHNESCRNDYAGALVVAGQEGGDAACSSRDGTFSELEHLLKQKTFTRAEIDRLTELLHSKAVDMPMGNEEKRTEGVQSTPVFDFSSSLLEENRRVKVTSGGVVATPVTSSRILEDDIASPAELAKAYMGSRPSKVSPSMLSTRSQIVREDTPLLKNVQYVQKSPIPTVTTKNTGLGFRGNGFTTPRSRGRSAIYSMARTPYSRVRQTEAQKAMSSTNYVSGGTSAQSVSESDVLFGSNQTLKRRSYVMDDDLGSVGPMRRIRQKPNLLSHGVSRLSAGVASAANLHQEVSKAVEDDENNKTTPTRHVAVPPKSSETAAKILEHLEKMTPKGKSSESKLVAGRNRIPNKLTPNMLHGRALRSLEDLDSPKLLQSAQDSYKLENWSKVFSPSPRELKKCEIEQNGHESSVSEPNVIAKNDAIFSFKDAQPNTQTNSQDDKSAAQPPLKKRGFRMSALEDSDELEEDISFNGPSCQLAEGRGKLEVYVTDQSLYAAEPTNKPATVDEVRAPLGVLDKKADMENPDTAGAITVSDTSLLPNADSRLLNVKPLESAPIKSKETNVDKVPPFLFSSSTPFTGSNLESSSSLSNILSSPADARPNPFESSNSQKAVDSNGKLQALSCGPSSSMSTNGNFAFGAVSSTSGLSNGLSGPSPAISASSPLVPDNFVKDVSNSSPSVAPSVSIGSMIRTTAGSSTVSASSIFGSSAASLVSEEPQTKLGSSEVLPKIYSALSTTSTPETTDMKAKSETGTTFGNLKSSPLPPAISGSIFGFSSSVMSGGTQSQGSNVSTGGDLFVSAQASVVGSGYSDVSGSIPACFGSSASSPSTGNIPVFGNAPCTTGQVSASPSNSNLVGSSNAASGILAFGVSSSAPNPAGSSSAPNAAGSSSAPNAAGSSFGPSNGAVPVAFTFGANSATPASEACAPATSSSATPGLFNFGGSSSAFSTNAVNISSSTTSSMFSFGANSSSSSTTSISTSAATSVFKFGGSTSTSPTIAVSTSANATPGIFNFGATSSASLTNASSTVNPIPFTFGATSASPQTSTTSGAFGSSWQPAKSPGFSSPFSSSTPTGFTFGASSSSFATPSTSAGVFGSMASASSGSAFSFGSTSATNSFSQPVFGNSTPSFAASPGNNNNMEDSSMVEDPVQAPGPLVPFVQPSVSPSPTDFVFGSTPSPFQFGGQPIQAVPQNSSPFAASGSQDFGAGGSFSLGSNGPDKSNRRMVKVNRNNKNRRK